MENTEENKKKQGKYRRKVSCIEIIYGKYGRKVSRIVKMIWTLSKKPKLNSEKI